MLLPSLLEGFCFEDAGKQYGIHYRLLESIAGIESNMNPKAFNINRNSSFDVGLMQINSFWIKILGLNKDELISNPCYNVMVGANILKRCINRYGFNWEAVGCYNATDSQKRINYSWRLFYNLRNELPQGKTQGIGNKKTMQEPPQGKIRGIELRDNKERNQVTRHTSCNAKTCDALAIPVLLFSVKDKYEE
jgi:hypothetical protein